MQHFALFKHQQHSSCEKLCQLCFIELARKQKNFPELLLLLAGKLHPQWQAQSGVFAGAEGHGGAPYNRVGAACPQTLNPPLDPLLAELVLRVYPFPKWAVNKMLQKGSQGLLHVMSFCPLKGFLEKFLNGTHNNKKIWIPPFKAPPLPTCAVIVHHGG